MGTSIHLFRMSDSSRRWSANCRRSPALVADHVGDPVDFAHGSRVGLTRTARSLIGPDRADYRLNKANPPDRIHRSRAWDRLVTTNEGYRMTDLSLTRWNGRFRRVIHATCVPRRGPAGSITLVVSTRGGVITLDPRDPDACAIIIDEDGGRELRDTLIRWLG